MSRALAIWVPAPLNTRPSKSNDGNYGAKEESRPRVHGGRCILPRRVLLKVQAEGPHSIRLQEVAEEVLLLIWQRQCLPEIVIHSRETLPGPGRRRGHLVPIKSSVTYQPQPHITLWRFNNDHITLWFIPDPNLPTLTPKCLNRLSWDSVRDQLSIIHLANNLPTEVPEAIKLPISMGKKRFSHKFLIISVKNFDANWNRFIGEDRNHVEAASSESN